MKTKLKVLMVFMAFIYICAILIAGKINPLEWSNTLRYFTVILLGISGLCILMVEEETYDKTSHYDEEPDYEWEDEIRRGR